MSNSTLVSYTKLSPNCNKPRNHKIDTITIHHMAGNLTVEGCGNVFAPTSRQASSNYGIGSDGRIGMYVEECNRSWCSSNGTNDHRAITIEVANDAEGVKNKTWTVSDKAMKSLIELCADICKRNGIEKLVWSDKKDDRVNHKNGCNMTVHRDFAATACPEAYMMSKMGYIAAEVNKKLKAPRTAPQAETPYVVKVTCDVLNVRNGAGTSYSVVRTVKKNEAYTIVEEKDGWGKLKSGAGWICLNYTNKL